MERTRERVRERQRERERERERAKREQRERKERAKREEETHTHNTTHTHTRTHARTHTHTRLRRLRLRRRWRGATARGACPRRGQTRLCRRTPSPGSSRHRLSRRRRLRRLVGGMGPATASPGRIPSLVPNQVPSRIPSPPYSPARGSFRPARMPPGAGGGSAVLLLSLPPGYSPPAAGTTAYPASRFCAAGTRTARPELGLRAGNPDPGGPAPFWTSELRLLETLSAAEAAAHEDAEAAARGAAEAEARSTLQRRRQPSLAAVVAACAAVEQRFAAGAATVEVLALIRLADPTASVAAAFVEHAKEATATPAQDTAGPGQPIRRRRRPAAVAAESDTVAVSQNVNETAFAELSVSPAAAVAPISPRCSWRRTSCQQASHPLRCRSHQPCPMAAAHCYTHSCITMPSAAAAAAAAAAASPATAAGVSATVFQADKQLTVAGAPN